MIFTDRQLVEKSLEHTDKSFLTFIYLKKAYDSVPKEAMWLELEKLDVPDEIVRLSILFVRAWRLRFAWVGICKSSLM